MWYVKHWFEPFPVQVRHELWQESQVLVEEFPKKDPAHEVTQLFDYKNFPDAQDVHVVADV